MTTYNPTYDWTYLDASYLVGTCSGPPNACLTDHAPGNLAHVRLWVFQGCQSSRYYGNNYSPAYSLLDEAYTILGVDSTVGFYNDIDYTPTTSTAWDYEFFYSLRNGNQVSYALYQASQYVASVNGGNTGGYGSWQYEGGGVKITPPQWGS